MWQPTMAVPIRNRLDEKECERLVSDDVKVYAQLTIDRANATKLPRFQSLADQRRAWYLT
jgi:hypothetical protein